ncbi:hypothetical protein PMIN01_11874 [Paraphaeosphaeria minitans]|uniref:Uncharacterized protein n=1 Tax=Paraphaeosphaeria minitans TaxID=565426 RepID=A0A9P6KKU1_9PLEO|nr:hypothetical protein PMIN01_11874 [Paraphaeosphaeria minitans]
MKQLRDAGHYPAVKGKGTEPYKKYEEAKRKIARTNQRLHKQRLNLAIREFHDSIDTIHIAKQLSGQAAAEALTLPVTEIELKERASVASMLFRPVRNDGMRVKLVRLVIRLCRRQQTRRLKALKRKKTERVIHTEGISNKREKKVSVADEGPQDFEPHQHDTTGKTTSCSESSYKT